MTYFENGWTYINGLYADDGFGNALYISIVSFHNSLAFRGRGYEFH